MLTDRVKTAAFVLVVILVQQPQLKRCCWTSWTEANNLDTARDYLSGRGLSSVILFLEVTETWDGTNWKDNRSKY